ncbi:lipid-A-disaccharide synthase [Rhodomicrobium lacus]|jgi:lipid-A-disaccharide synthase|uniref:lipid-A-disaccharide synthase n=1 Tax=Rhodomicrobium TaxID=1068 RepID=UPI000F8EAB72|nr:lipid-A-disaccharide synthase [Rhodomicrobium lacus]
MAEARRIFIVAGEHSGDVLGAKLMEALKARAGEDAFEFAGVGGDEMHAAGLASIFPLSDVAVMGPAAILARLPKLVRRVWRAVDAALAYNPHAVIIVDSPEFTHPIAKRIRRQRPDIPIVDYVSPSVWAWRPGRAKKMKPYVDHLLALLPFEPAAHERLGGPPCSYVGHPLIERAPWIDSLDTERFRARLGIAPGRPVLLVLPGSRTSEVSRLMQPFGETVLALGQKIGPFSMLLPAVPHVRGMIEEAIADWPNKPHLLEGDEDKFTAFRLADAALAASGTVTLELGVAGTPMVVAYRVDPFAARLRFLLKVHSVVLANLVLGENAFPEFIQEDCTAPKLADALAPLLGGDTPERAAQLAALAKIRERMFLAQGTPSARAAEVVLSVLDGAPARAAAA